MTWQARMQHVVSSYRSQFRETTVTLGAKDIRVLIAETPTQWAAGMAGQPDSVEGMIFVMPPGSRTGFHMRGMEVPLVIAFFDENGRLLDVERMEPGTEFHPDAPYSYALELRDVNLRTYFDLFVDGLDVDGLR